MGESFARQKAKSRHPSGGVVGALEGPHSLAGERPARLLRVFARMRAKTLFCCLRPGRACHQNSPARPSGKAGPPRFVAFHNASLRSYLPCSAVPRPNQGGPVSPDGRAASAVRMLRTFSSPWTGSEKADRENRVGAIIPLPAAWARRASVRIAFYRASLRASAYRSTMCSLRRSAEGCQHLLGVGGGLLAAKSSHLILIGGGAAFGACSPSGARAGRFVSAHFLAPSRIAIARPSAGLACSALLEMSGRHRRRFTLRALRPRPACGGLDLLAPGNRQIVACDTDFLFKHLHCCKLAVLRPSADSACLQQCC